MIRNNRISKIKNKSTVDKMILYIGSILLILGIIIFSLFMYSKRVSDDVKRSTLELGEITNNLSNENKTETETEDVSTGVGKTIEEVESEKEEETNSEFLDLNTDKSSTEEKVNTNTETNTNSQSIATVTNTNKKDETKKEKVELKFQKPVEGDIVKEFAKDNLLYSNTLDEWTTHLGIDIKADKTTVVNSSEKGTVKSIKNDPRYGLTIVIDHGDGYETRYSNLLTSEFVVEGEKVEKGQAIGTVGNTAVFEIADEPHLHFEILKDSIEQDPKTYFK